MWGFFIPELNKLIKPQFYHLTYLAMEYNEITGDEYNIIRATALL